MIQTELRAQRLAAGVSLDVVSLVSGVDRCTLSLAERGLVSITPQRARDISEAITDLKAKRLLVANFAATVGWPSVKF